MMTINSLKDHGQMNEDELEDLYNWIDDIPLSRPKKNMTRDFSDGVLVAEVIKHVFPKLVHIHNYPPTNKTLGKMENWDTLNRKVLRKLQFKLSEDVIQQIVASKPGVIEHVLFMLKTRLSCVQWDIKVQQRKETLQSKHPDVDQYSTSRICSQRNVNTTLFGGGGVKFASGMTQMHKGGARRPQDDWVPLILLEEKEQEVLAKDETIKILQAKIKRLEHLVHLKDIRIEDLQACVQKLPQTGRR
ncbi:sperm flagellar protein 1-like [Babylonia areolata]|uniref:sperm flagellar protein 1-like n=1 Tax=Babylonia areolata TaxID=304850 RepID=UPI003FCEFFDF